MIFHVLTIFPEMVRGALAHGVVGRAVEEGRIEVRAYDLRKWTYDRHRSVDDRPFGGGEGMVLKAEPVARAVEEILPERGAGRRVILLSAQGGLFNQRAARRLSTYEEILLICGRYEGVDERVAEHVADEELSIGDYVLSGGEIAAAVVVDAVARLKPGVLGNERSAGSESHEGLGILDYPHYTRPAEFRGWRVPEVLLGGNHEEIRRWRQQAAMAKTARLRPDLAERHATTPPMPEDRSTQEGMTRNDQRAG